MDGLLDSFWTWFRDHDIAKWDMLEAYVAGFSFTLWIATYRTLDEMDAMGKFRFAGRNKRTKSSYLHMESWLPLFIYLLSIHVYHFFINR